MEVKKNIADSSIELLSINAKSEPPSIEIKITIRNKKMTVLHLDPYIKGPTPKGNLFEVIDSKKKKVGYRGIMAKRSIPDEGEFIKIKPNTDFTTVFKLNTDDHYRLIKNEVYHIKLKATNHFSEDDVIFESEPKTFVFE